MKISSVQWVSSRFAVGLGGTTKPVNEAAMCHAQFSAVFLPSSFKSKKWIAALYASYFIWFLSRKPYLEGLDGSSLMEGNRRRRWWSVTKTRAPWLQQAFSLERVIVVNVVETTTQFVLILLLVTITMGFALRILRARCHHMVTIFFAVYQRWFERYSSFTMCSFLT